MKIKYILVCVLTVCLSCITNKKETKTEENSKEEVTEVLENNPVIRHVRTADPSAHVW